MLSDHQPLIMLKYYIQYHISVARKRHLIGSFPVFCPSWEHKLSSMLQLLRILNPMNVSIIESVILSVG